jgi:hypothetical protein
MITEQKIKEMEKLQQKSRKFWSDEENEDLKKCIRHGFSIDVIYRAKIFNRSKKSIGIQYYRLRGEMNDEKTDSKKA